VDINFAAPIAAADFLPNQVILTDFFDLRFKVVRQIPELAATVDIDC